jgi:hypothetical protein
MFTEVDLSRPLVVNDKSTAGPLWLHFEEFFLFGDYWKQTRLVAFARADHAIAVRGQIGLRAGVVRPFAARFKIVAGGFHQ